LPAGGGPDALAALAVLVASVEHLLFLEAGRGRSCHVAGFVSAGGDALSAVPASLREQPAEISQKAKRPAGAPVSRFRYQFNR